MKKYRGWKICWDGSFGAGLAIITFLIVALFGNFNPCGVYEAIDIFGGIDEGDEALRPDTIDGGYAT